MIVMASCVSSICDECWRANEWKVICYDYNVPEDLCPGVPATYCKKKNRRCVCGCVTGTFRRMDWECVPYRECEHRIMEPMLLLTSDEDLIMVGVSGDMYRWAPVSCFKSQFIAYKNQTLRRTIQYESGRYGRLQSNVTLEVEMHKGGKAADIKINPGEKPPLHVNPKYEILYATKHCIIFGTMPQPKLRTYCTYWVKKSAVKNRNWACDFILNHYCRSPEIVIKDTEACWPEGNA